MRRMNRGIPLAGLAALVLGGASLLPPAPLRAAQDPDEKGNKPSTTAGRSGERKSSAPAPAAADDAQDPAFGRYVDLRLLNQAWRDLNADLLADVALQLANGEEVLHRPHKGISAKQLMEQAAKLAVETNSPETIDRLIAAAKASNNAELANSLGATRKLVDSSRGEGAATIAIDQLSTEELSLLKSWMNKVRVAKVQGDRETLRQIEGQIPKIADLKEKPRSVLKSLVADALKSVPEGSGERPGASDALSKLSAASRGDYQVGSVGPGQGGGYSYKLQAPLAIRPVTIGGYNVRAAIIAGFPGPYSPLNNVGLTEGDIITRLDGIPAHNIAEMDTHFGSTSVRYVKADNLDYVLETTIYLPGNGGGGGGFIPGGNGGGGPPP